METAQREKQGKMKKKAEKDEIEKEERMQLGNPENAGTSG